MVQEAPGPLPPPVSELTGTWATSAPSEGTGVAMVKNASIAIIRMSREESR